jgi:cellulose synthase/poly-beta-1,6-N-acetylglucosamine synthase-like glycosyltransferase
MADVGEIILHWVNDILLGIAIVLLIPVGVFCAECLAALLPSRGRQKHTESGRLKQLNRPTVAIIIPAHNEESGLAETLRTLSPQLDPADRVLVVADNCNDATAAVARSLGAIVIERHDASHHGKGFALDYGIRSLRQNPPDVVVMIDADCHVAPGAIAALVRQAVDTGRPAQACYLMERPAALQPKAYVSTLAFLVKNLVRPRGLFRLGLPCMLTGTGMAFPWSTIAKAHLASDNIVEDMQLGLDLAVHGAAPLFCGEAFVTGRLPNKTKIAYGQRTRWEHGHLQTILTQAPRLLRIGFARRQIQVIALAMDLAVPPLALLMLMLSSALAIMATAAMSGAGWLPARMLIGGIAAVMVCLLAAWVRFGRGIVPISALLAAPIYMAWKVPMYLAFFFKRQTRWNPTSRSIEGDLSAESAPLEGNLVDDSARGRRAVQPAMEIEAAGTRATVYQSFLNGFAFEMGPTLPCRLEDPATLLNGKANLELHARSCERDAGHAVPAPTAR